MTYGLDMHRCVRPFVASLGMAIVAGSVATTGAQAAYTAPAPFTGTGEMTRNLVAGAASDGSAAIAYAQAGQIRVAVKAPGQLFGPATTIGPGRAPQLAMGPNGRAVLSWISPTDEARVALRAPGAQSFTEVAPISAGDASSVAVAVAENGRAYAAARLVNGALMSSYGPSSTEAVPAVELLPTGAPTSVAIAIEGSGEIAWLLVNSRSATISHATARRWSSSLGQGPPLELTADANSPVISTVTTTYGPAVGVSGAQPSFLWTRLASSTIGLASSSVARVDGPLTAPTTPNVTSPINTSGGVIPERSVPSVATAADGSALVGWVDAKDSAGTNPTIRVVSRSPTGQWSSPLEISELTSAFNAPAISRLALAPGQAGGAQVLYPVGLDRLITASLTPARTLTSPEPTLLRTAPVGSQIGEAAAGGTGNGDTALAWVERSAATGDGVVQVALGDVTPPKVAVAPPTAVPMIPAEGIKFTTPAEVSAFNQRVRNVTLEAFAQDTWTPTTVTWDFGDGTTATGPKVNHQFDPALAGATITATARDLAGNTTTATTSRSFPTATLAAAPSVALSGLKLNRTRFAVNKPGKPATKNAKKGATVSYVLTTAGKVEFGVTTKARGYRSTDGKVCAARKPKGVKKPKRCSFDRSLGIAGTVEGSAGPNTFALTGKAAGRSLKPGKYTLTAGIYPRLQSHASLAATAKFTIVK